MPTERAAANARAGAYLEVDLKAIQENYRRLKSRLGRAECAAVIKADAYGLGATQVGPALWAAGARRFFVALPDEAIALRKVLPTAQVYVLGGLFGGAERDYLAHGICPVLNSLSEIAAWRALPRAERPPAALHFDSGISRLGLPADEAARLIEDPTLLRGIEIGCVMSHLACAEEPDHPLNQRQRQTFLAFSRAFPGLTLSLANSSGVFLGPDYHFDLARPGIALYGGNPTPGSENPMTSCIRLRSRVLQVRDIAPGESVGYGASFTATQPTRIATVAIGYADGYSRYLSNAGRLWLAEYCAPIVGRISMDLITLDVSELPADISMPGALVDLIGDRETVDDIAERAGTIAYEVLTSLGGRFHRTYKEA